MRDSWSDDRIALLRQMWAAGATAQSIAGALGGLSRSAVLGKIFRLRLDGSAGAPPPAPNVLPAWRRASKRAKALAEARPAPARRGKSLLELSNECCRWPHGQPGTARFFFCGAPGADLERGMPYCARHAQRAYPNGPNLTVPAMRAAAPAAASRRAWPSGDAMAPPAARRGSFAGRTAR